MPNSGRARCEMAMITPSARFRVDAEEVGKRVAVDDQRVIARGLHRRRTAGEEAFALVPDLAHLAVHRHAPRTTRAPKASPMA